MSIAQGYAPHGAGGGSGRFAALSQAIGLDEIVDTLLRRKLAIALTALAIMVLTALALAMSPDRYTSSMDITIDPRGFDAVEKELTPPDMTPEGRTTAINTMMQVAMSDSVLSRVVASQNLAADPEFAGRQGGLRAALRALAGGGRPPTEPERLALETLRDSAWVSHTPSTFVVHVAVRTRDADKSRRLVEALAAAFMEQRAEDRRSGARRVSQGLDERLEEMRAQVAQAEDRIETFKAENNIFDSGGRLNNEQQLTELTNQIGLARARSAEMRARYEQIRQAAAAGSGVDDLPEAIRSQTITQLRAQYAQSRQRLDSLAATHGPRHPDLVETRAQTESLERQIGAELQRIAASAERDYEQARATEIDLTGKLDGLKDQSSDVNQALIRLRQLEREAKASRDVYETFLSRARQIREQEDLDTSNIRIISPAQTPLKADGPSSAIMLFVALMAGLSLGAIAAVLFDAVSGRVHSPRALAQQSGLAVIARLPLPRAAPRLALPGRSRPQALPILVDEMRDDALAHGLLSVYDALKRYAPALGPQVVLVVSPGGGTGLGPHGHGRAATALNLAVTASLCGETTLLVDFDVAQAQISRALRGPAAAGLDAVLAGRRPLAQALHGVQGTSLAVLPNFRLDPAAVHAGPAAIAQAVIEPARHCGMIVIDAGQPASGPPPALAEVASDIVVAVDGGKVSLGALERLREALGANAAKVLGAVYLSDAPAPAGIKHAAWSPLAPSRPVAPFYGQEPDRHRYRDVPR